MVSYRADGMVNDFFAAQAALGETLAAAVVPDELLGRRRNALDEEDLEAVADTVGDVWR